MPFIHSQANPGPRWATLLLLPAPIGLEISGPDLLPSRPCPKPGRQTVSCVKVACDLGFPCKLGGQQDRSHCVCLTVMLHPPSRGIRDHCRLGQILAHSSRLLGVGCATTGSAWPCTMDKCAFAVTSGIYKPQCLMGTPQGTQPWSPSTTLPPSHTQAASISLTVPFWILSFVNLLCVRVHVYLNVRRRGSQLSPSTFMWAQGIEHRSPSSHPKRLYSWGHHLACPVPCFQFFPYRPHFLRPRSTD